MASVTGSRIGFAGTGFSATQTNVILTADGKNAIDNNGNVLGTVASQSVSGKLNIEVFTTAAGAAVGADAKVQASAEFDGAQLLFPGDAGNPNFIQAGSPGSTEKLLTGSNLTVTDFSGGSSPNESIQIVGGSGDTVVGSAGDTITGSSDATVTQTIDASGFLVNAAGPFKGFPAPGPETVIGGAGATFVTGGKGDKVTGGAGALAFADGTGGGGNETVTGGAGSMSVGIIGKNSSVTGSTGGTTLIDDTATGGNSTLIGGNGTGTLGSGINTLINAAAGDQVTVGSGASLVYAFKGPTTVTGGAGTVTGVFGLAINSVIAAGQGDQINLGAGSAFVDAFSSPAKGTTVIGGSGFAVDLAGAGVSVVGGSGKAANQTAAIPIAGGSTVTGGTGDLLVFDIGKGESVTGSTGGWTAINDAYGIGGNSKLVGGSSTVVGAVGSPAVGFSSFIVGAAGDTITGGAGTTSVNAFIGGKQTVTGGTGNMTVLSATGDSINGGTGTLLAFLNTDQTGQTISLGAGHGAATLQDVTVSGTTVKGSSTVTGFASATDIIGSSTSVDAGGNFLGKSASDGAGGTLLTFVDGSTMDVAGIAAIGSIKFLKTSQ